MRWRGGFRGGFGRLFFAGLFRRETQRRGCFHHRRDAGFGQLGQGGPEQARRDGHVQRLVRPGVVIAMHPRVDGGLGRGHVGELPDLIQQLTPQCLVKPFDLPGRGR
jgi:hypothetical protein